MFARKIRLLLLIGLVNLLGLQGCSVLLTGLRKPKIEILEEQISYNFEVVKLENKESSIVSSDDDRLIFINFWSTYCAPCIKELPVINKLQREEKDNCDFYVIGLDTPERQEKFLRKKGFSFPPYYLNVAGYPENLQTQIVPTTYLLKGDKVLLKHQGSANWNVEKVKSLIRKYKNN